MRDKFYELIKENALDIGIGIITPEVIDKVNIYEATKLAMKSAIKDLTLQPDYLLLDAMKLDVPIEQDSIIKGDAKSVTISASSVIAKVTRDRMMMDLDKKIPQYGFGQHMGYGTQYHLSAMKTHGITEHHRKSFAPVRELLDI
jgi:ribonuclease HII